MNQILSIILVSLVSLACQSAAAQQHTDVIDKFVTAFNAHDAAKMASMVSEEFQLFSMNEEGQADLATSGPAALESEMTQYFAGLPSVRSTIDGRNEVGNYVSFRETASWKAKDGQEKSQSSLAVYQVKDNKIHRVWYYPAQ